MAFFNTKQTRIIPPPIPPIPPYVPPDIPQVQPGSTPVVPRPTFSSNVTLNLYHCYDDDKTVNKTLEDMLTFSILLKSTTDILHPVIVLESNDMLSSYNYAYINVTDRYYFVTRCEYLGSNKFKLYLTCDVLMSHKTAIKNMTGIMVKSDDVRYINEDYNDGSFVNQDGCAIAVKVFPTKPFLDTPKNVLIVSG